MTLTKGKQMTTHDIELRSAVMGVITDVWDRTKQIDDAVDEVLDLIEADRKRRGKPVSKIDPNPPPLSIVWHDSPESVDRAMWEQAAIEAGVTYEDLIEGSNVGETEDGGVLEFTHEQAIDGMRTQGCWGFVDTKTNTINAWAADDVDASTALHFLSHEIGHVTGEQLDDDMQEEMRAEQFGRVAALAYRLWCEKRNVAPQPAEPVDADLVQRWQREHGVVLTPGTREAAMVVIRHDEDGKPTVWCDPEIADLVRALNDGGVATVASCSGHGRRPGNIMLADGRVLVVCKDADEAREVESCFPGINGEAPQPAEPVKVPSDDIDIEDVRQYLDSWGCLAHPGVRALLARYGKGAP